MAVQIPCLSCRLTTPAADDAASVSCQSCGMALPPPAQAAWSMLRDGAQFGPYPVALLAAWIAEGRILPKDHVWHQGAAVRLEVDQLPPLGAAPAAAQPAPPPEPVAAPEPEPTPVEAAAAEPEPAPVEAPAPEPEPEPVEAAAPEPEPEPVEPATPEPEPVEAVAPEPEPVEPAAPEPEPVEAAAPEPEPEPVEPATPEPVPVEAAAPEPEPEPIEVAEPEPAPVETAAPEPVPEEPEAAEPAAEVRPALTVHIPCLDCRTATPVAEEVAEVSCQSCGTALPAPAQAAWFMLRDGAQFGPYTTGQLAGYIGEGRILKQDNVWYQGAAVRLEVSQLPPFGEVEVQPEAESAPVETPAPAETAAPDTAPVPTALASTLGEGDWDSLEIQPGETKLGDWVVGLVTNWRDVAGSLIVTDKRLMFKPKIAGATMVGILVSQTRGFKDDHTVILARDEINDVFSKKQVLNRYVYVTTVYGDTIGFNRGVMKVDPILDALLPPADMPVAAAAPAPAVAEAAEPAPVPAEPDASAPAPVEAQAGANILVPCLGCRSATPAQEDAATLSCQSCGAALPPPAQAAWSMMRDEAQYGPYTIAALAGYVAEGRARPQDSIWHQGASVRLEVQQLPPFGVTAAPAATPLPAQPAPAPANVDLQPGETSLGSWNVLHRHDEEIARTGTLTVTNRRLLFDPLIESFAEMEIEGDREEVIRRDYSATIDKDEIADIAVEQDLAEKVVRLQLASGATVRFRRGMLMSVDPIVAAIRER